MRTKMVVSLVAVLAVTTPASAFADGGFPLPSPLEVIAASPADTGGAMAPPGGPVLTYTGPLSNDPVTLSVLQDISADDPLRSGGYSKTLTFAASITAP
jgi:hypothetical protein